MNLIRFSVGSIRFYLFYLEFRAFIASLNKLFSHKINIRKIGVCISCWFAFFYLLVVLLNSNL